MSAQCRSTTPAQTSLHPRNSIGFTLSFLLLTSVSPLFSQVTFQIAFGGPDYDVSHMMMQVTSNGTYIFTGETYSFGAGSDDIYTAEISATGSVLWSKTYGTSGSERSDCIRQTTDGGYIIAGFKAVPGAGNDVCLVKIDASGNVAWNRTYGGIMSDEPSSVRQTADGGYIVLGYTANYTSTLNLEMYVIKTDDTGIVQWTKTYGVNGFLSDAGRDIVQTPDLNYMIMGQTSTPGATDVALIKISKALGTVIWAKRYNFYQFDQPQTFELTNDSGFIVTGYASTGANEDIMLLKTDQDGNVQWANTYGDVYSNRGWGVTQTYDGGFAITGSWRAAAVTGEDMYIMKTDAGGNLQFIKTMGSSQDDLGYIIRQTPADSGFAVSGITCCGGIGPGDRDFMLSKTDKLGNIVGVCNLLTPTVTTTSIGVTGIAMTISTNIFGATAIPFLTVMAPPTQSVILCNYIPLPVELLSFTAQASDDMSVLLRWQTASEVNNDYFSVERSKDGEHFDKVAVLDGAGNSSTEQNYSFQDEKLPAGILYYRLRQTDFDGQFTLSQTIAVNTGIRYGFSIFPNPAMDKITLYLSGATGQSAELSISNTVGKVIFQRKIVSFENDDPVTIPIPDIASGIYYVSCLSSGNLCVKKLVIDND
jgi:hypothetical protein